MPNKYKLVQECKRIRDKYENGVYLSSEDQEWLIDNVFKYHPNWDWWYNQGITHFSVNRDGYRSRCFYVHFSNPEKYSSANISWNKSIRNIH